jgi:outer membrane protein assembly factor BamB
MLLIAVSVWVARSGRQPDRWQMAGAEALTDSLADEVVVQGDQLYLLRRGHLRSFVAALDARTGRQRWCAAVPSIGYLAADERRAYCLAATRPGVLELIALNAGTGDVAWRYQRKGVHSRHAAAPVPSGDRVCWTTGDRVSVIDAGSGREIWTTRVGAPGRLSNPVRAGDRIYLACPEAVHVFDAESGEDRNRWAFPQTGPTRGHPVLGFDDGRLYVAVERADGASEAGCFDVASGKIAWRRRIPGAQHLVAVGGVLCLRGSTVQGLEARSGRTLWTFDAAGCGPLYAGDGRVHFVDTTGEGTLLALDARTGRSRWAVDGVRSCDAFARVGDTGVIKTQDGVVHAIAMRD